MEEDLTNKRPIYVKQCIRNIIMEEIIMKQKEQQNNSSTDTKNNKNIILRVLGYVVNIIAYNKVQIDDGTAIMDAELLRVEKQKEDEDNNSDNNNKNNNKRHRNDNNKRKQKLTEAINQWKKKNNDKMQTINKLPESKRKTTINAEFCKDHKKKGKLSLDSDELLDKAKQTIEKITD